MVEEHESRAGFGALLDGSSLLGRRIHELDGRVGVRESETRHVGEHDHVVARFGLLPSVPGDVVEGVEDREERVGLERVPSCDEEDVDVGFGRVRPARPSSIGP